MMPRLAITILCCYQLLQVSIEQSVDSDTPQCRGQFDLYFVLDRFVKCKICKTPICLDLHGVQDFFAIKRKKLIIIFMYIIIIIITNHDLCTFNAINLNLKWLRYKVILITDKGNASE